MQHLSLVNKLWAVLKNVFAASWLPPPAEVILAGVLKRNYNLEDERVKSAWSRLCADLISVGLPALLHIVSVRTAHNEELEVTRQLWSVLAKSWKESDNGTHWEELVSFLIIPLGYVFHRTQTPDTCIEPLPVRGPYPSAKLNSGTGPFVMPCQLPGSLP